MLHATMPLRITINRKFYLCPSIYQQHTIHMKNKIFKFGGAAVVDANGVQNTCNIIKDYGRSPLLVVVSAMGKTTNALEAIVDAYFQKQSEQALQLLHLLRQQHFDIIAKLFDEQDSVFAKVNDLFVEIEWVLEDPVEDPYDYIYDQIVSIGELVSTTIVAAYLQKIDINTYWLDARDILLTDDTFRDARILWEKTEQRISQKVKPLLKKYDVVLTQGFIGSTDDNRNTTLGREGSDFSAAIFGYCLNAQDISIWKDVPGVLTADPNLFDNVVHIHRLSYKEAIEMTYYGAKVIHPKTIKPLQNKNIPLFVKSFLAPEKQGTLISNENDAVPYPPIIVTEHAQCLLYISTKDFSFIAEKHISHIFKLFDRFRIKVNMMQNMAISFSVCIHNNPKRLEKLIQALQENFKIVIENNLELLTIRHYNEEVLHELTKGKIILLEERIRQTVQVVMRSVPLVKWKE